MRKSNNKNKMVGKMKVKSKGGDGSKAKENKRWIFDDDMTACLVESLKNYKADKEGEEIDFEGDLVKVVSQHSRGHGCEI